MDEHTLRQTYSLDPCVRLLASRVSTLGLGQFVSLRFKDEATGERNRVADKMDLGAPIPLADEVMLRSATCDWEGVWAELQPTMSSRVDRCRSWPDTNGQSVEAASPSGGEGLAEGTLVDSRRRVPEHGRRCAGTPCPASPQPVCFE